MTSYKDYGYHSNQFGYAHSYLIPGLLKVLEHEKDKTILDLGCGNGAIASFLIDSGYNVYGVDASASGIEQAKKNNFDRFYQMDVSTDELPKELSGITFDIIISTEVIEHIYSPAGFIALCTKILSKSNHKVLIISTPYHGYLKNMVLAVTNQMDKHYTALWEGGHIKFWSRNTLTRLLLQNNYEVIEFMGCGRLPYLWKSMLVKAKFIESNKKQAEL